MDSIYAVIGTWVAHPLASRPCRHILNDSRLSRRLSQTKKSLFTDSLPSQPVAHTLPAYTNSLTPNLCSMRPRKLEIYS
ncbi:hypothetical protein BD309DRAFT_718066 [Dichomitus squalens]|nr:hypothetical protein BD309DRAFT_718066 [Dichomitus squalens]